MTEEFTSIKYYVKAYTATSWTDITELVKDSPRPRGQMGIQNNGLMDRVADGGRMTIAVDNSSGTYFKDTTLEGMFKMETTWDGVPALIFLGYYEPGTKKTKPFLGSRFVEVTFRDWFAWAIEYELEVLEYATSQTMQQAVWEMLTNMPMLPTYKSYARIYYTFPDMFDTTGSGTTFGGECTKLANSEFGYIYQRYRTDGDELVLQGRTARSIGSFGYGALTPLPVYSGDHSGDAWQLEANTDQWLTESGDLWLLEENSTVTITAADLLVGGQNEIVQDAHAVNFAKISVRPRSLASVGVLWTMESPQLVEAGQTLTDIVGRYRDTSSGASYVNGINMIQPVVNTDFKAYANSDGTGTDLTNNLVVVADFSKTSEVKFTSITNTGVTDFYIGGPDIVFQVRGEAVKIYDAITVVRDLSAVAYNDLPTPYAGKKIINFDMYYQDDINEVAGFLETPTYWKALPRTNPMSLTINVNRNTTTMRLWQYGRVGTALVANLSNTYITFNKNIYINGYSFEVVEGKYIHMTIVPFEEDRAVITDI